MKWSRLCLSDRIRKIWNWSKILYLRILKIKNRFLKNVSWRCPESGSLGKKYAAWDVSNGAELRNYIKWRPRANTHKKALAHLCARVKRGARCALVAGAGFEPTTFGLWGRVSDYIKLWQFRLTSSNWRFAGKRLCYLVAILCRFWENSALLVPWGEIFTESMLTKIWN